MAICQAEIQLKEHVECMGVLSSVYKQALPSSSKEATTFELLILLCKEFMDQLFCYVFVSGMFI